MNIFPGTREVLISAPFCIKPGSPTLSPPMNTAIIKRQQCQEREQAPACDLLRDVVGAITFPSSPLPSVFIKRIY